MAISTNNTMQRLNTALLFSQPTFFSLMLLAGLPVLAAAWLLLSPSIVFAQQNALDLLFNLAGAWHLHSGNTHHVDFHEPVGQLNFLLTVIGFRVIGFSPNAFIVGQMFILAPLFAAAVVAALQRLPLAAAVTFVLFICLPSVMPVNVGNPLDAFTFAMSYNRYGWGAISVVCLILFVPPLQLPKRAWADLVCCAALLGAMFYLKISYFVIGVAALTLALLISNHVRAQWPAWLAIGLIVIANAVAPYSHPYLLDLWGAVQAGTGNIGVARFFLHGVLGNGTEFAVYCASLVAAVFLWRGGRAPLRVPVAALFLIGTSVMLFSQNTQVHGLPLGTVIMFMLYATLLQHRTPATATQLVVLLLVPTLTFLGAFGSLFAYHVVAKPSAKLFVINQTNLRGLAVPIATNDGGFTRPQYLYLVSLLEAAALFTDGSHMKGRIQIIDRVNPLPFMLGIDPPKGGDLFWEPAASLRPAVEVLGDADYVLVPKASTATNLTAAAATKYNSYLVEHFPRREETTYWTVFSRI